MRPATELLAYEPAPGDPWQPVAAPLYQTATFAQPSALENGTFDYTRSGNPTRRVLEQQVARLERARAAFAFASGMAALTAVTRLLAPGDELLASDDLYGGSYRLFSRLLEPRGIRVRYADLSDLDATRAAMGPRTRLVHVESISNPLLRVADLPGLAALAREREARLCVDASALSPHLQRPLELGADFVVHSATKYLAGHADATAGVVSVGDAALAEELAFVQNAEGAALAPFECLLLLRGMATLALRLERQQANALELARWLQPRVRRLRHPGLESDPGHALLRRQAAGAGAVLSFETGSLERSAALVDALELFTTSVSFGSVRSTASLPCRMSHASIPPQVRRARRLPEDLVRLSIGIEDVRDLRDDLEQALHVVAQRGASIEPWPAARG